MEDVTVYVDCSLPPTAQVQTMVFSTDVEIDRTKFRKGASVTVYVERHGAVVPYRAFVSDVEDLETDSPQRKWVSPVTKGSKVKKDRTPAKAVSRIGLSFRDRPLVQEHLFGTVSVEVCSDDMAHIRRLQALARFRGKSDYISGELKGKILGNQDRVRYRQFKSQRECKELELPGLDEDQAEAVNLALQSNICLIKARTLYIMNLSPFFSNFNVFTEINNFNL